MILVDANLLLYAHHAGFGQHVAARRWLDERLNASPQVGLPWASLLAFVRLSVNPRVFERPLSVAQAWEQVSLWLACPNVWVPVPTERHASILSRLLPQAVGSPGLVMDAHLAAQAIEHGLELCSTDRDFGRFIELRWRNPLADDVRPATKR